MLKEYTLNVSLKDKANEAFATSYKIALREDFVTWKLPKELNLKNQTEGFVAQLKMNAKPIVKRSFQKWQIRVVNYGLNNTGSEINGNRPSIIYKHDDYTQGEDVTVIPLTSAIAGKLIDKFDVFVQKDENNVLFQNSHARLRQFKAVSVKKIGKPLGKITDEKLKAMIDTAMREMLGL